MSQKNWRLFLENIVDPGKNPSELLVGVCGSIFETLTLFSAQTGRYLECNPFTIVSLVLIYLLITKGQSTFFCLQALMVQ